MLIHFQIEGARDWEAMGSGVGSPPDQLSSAIEDLRAMHGGALPAGSYRYFSAPGVPELRGHFELDESGTVVN